MSTMTDTQTLPEATIGQRFYGKYRGTVVNNVDPMQTGRIQVMVPDVSNVAAESPCKKPSAFADGFLVPCPSIAVSISRRRRLRSRWPRSPAAP